MLGTYLQILFTKSGFPNWSIVYVGTNRNFDNKSSHIFGLFWRHSEVFGFKIVEYGSSVDDSKKLRELTRAMCLFIQQFKVMILELLF